MPNIVAGQFEDFKTAEAATRALKDEGVSPAAVDTFFLNAAGQHARFLIGGDQMADPEARGAEKGALAGGAIGGAAGVALGAALAPVAGVAAAAGAVAGGVSAGLLAGAMHSLSKHDRPPDPLSRPAGVVVAVYAPTSAERERATSVFRRLGAHAIEEADGTWKDGTWLDFNPVSIPKWRRAPEP
jgi:hypothetical protein